MQTRRDRLIREALERSAAAQETAAAEAGGSVPARLRDQALAHTGDDYLPKTLTAHEWQDYYAAHGVPEEHRRPVHARQSRWQRLLHILRQSRSPASRNCSRNIDEDAEF